jgi:hypothetical protein
LATFDSTAAPTGTAYTTASETDLPDASRTITSIEAAAP